MSWLRFGTDRSEMGNLPYGSEGNPVNTTKISMAAANAEIDKILREKVPFLGTIKFPTRADAEQEFIERMQKANMEIQGPPPAGYRADWKPPFLGARGPSFLNPAQPLPPLPSSHVNGDEIQPRPRSVTQILVATAAATLGAVILGASIPALLIGKSKR